MAAASISALMIVPSRPVPEIASISTPRSLASLLRRGEHPGAIARPHDRLGRLVEPTNDWGRPRGVGSRARFPDLSRLANHRQQRLDFNRLTLRSTLMEEHPCVRRRDVDNRLVRLHLDEWCIHLDHIADFDMPMDDVGLGETLADIG